MALAKGGDGYWRAVALQALLLLDVVAILAAGGIWLARPYWETVTPPPVAEPEQWGPAALGDTGCWCWRPMGWKLRYAKSGEREEWHLEAGVGATLVLVAEKEPRHAATASRHRIEGLLQAMRTWSGFSASKPEAADVSIGPGYSARFAYWQVGGLRLLPWNGWIWAGRSMDRKWTACATFPAREGQAGFAAEAWQVLASVRTAKQNPPPPAPVADGHRRDDDDESE